MHIGLFATNHSFDTNRKKKNINCTGRKIVGLVIRSPVECRTNSPTRITSICGSTAFQAILGVLRNARGRGRGRFLAHMTIFRPPSSPNSVPQSRQRYRGLGEDSICLVRVELQAGHDTVSTASPWLLLIGIAPWLDATASAKSLAFRRDQRGYISVKGRENGVGLTSCQKNCALDPIGSLEATGGYRMAQDFHLVGC